MKWVYLNKLDENGQFVRNKERLVCKGYYQIEGIDFKKNYAPVSQMESIRMFLAFATFNKSNVYQMDVKFAFLNGKLKEEVCIGKLEGFRLEKDLDTIFKMKKELYGLKQTLRAWYGKLDKYLINQEFKKRWVNKNLYFNIN